jgi:hypothetical protein
LAISPTAQAVSPAPDGCYPGFTTAEGCNALAGLSSGQGNTGLGWYALAFARSANLNTAVGAGALALNTGDSNTAVGAVALLLNTTGTENVAVGTDALVHNTTGNNNVAIGEGAMINNVGSELNTVVGHGAGANIVNSGAGGNIYIGAGAGGTGDEVGFIRIGTPTIKSFPYDTYIAGIFDRDVDATTAVVVFADTNQKIGTNLVDANGNSVPFKPQAMLDESLKQRKRIAELEATVERQQKEMEMLTAQLKEQAAQIQRVSAQLELTKPAPQTVCLPAARPRMPSK